MIPPHHRSNGFRNPWPSADDSALGGLWKWIRVHRTTRGQEPDAPDSFPVALPDMAFPRGDAHGLRITWIGHSTFLLQIGGLNVLTDPVWSERASPVSFLGPRRRVPALPALGDLPPIDAVVISHDHYDHLDRATVRVLARLHANARWLVPLGLARLVSQWGVTNVAELDWWQEVRLGSLLFHCTPAQHWSGRGMFDRGKSLWCGWSIRAESEAVWFAGDTAMHPELATIAERLGPFSALLLPIGGIEPRWYMRRLHLDPAEAVEAFLAMQTTQSSAALMIAMHWGTFRIADEALSLPPRLLREAWGNRSLPDDQLWIPRHGETRVMRKLSHDRLIQRTQARSLATERQ